MAGQMTFAEEPSLSRRRKQTKRERFLAEIDAVVPWVRLMALIEPYYPKGGSGRKPMPLERMLRIHVLGNQWYFGRKAPVATDLQGIVQAVDFTAAKVPDYQRLDGLLTGDEPMVLADRGYDYPQVHDTLAARGIRDAVARRRYPGQKTGLAALKRYNRAIARIRARGEHAFRVLKCQFGYRRTRYRGLAKNGAQLTTLFALANLYLLRRYLLAA